MGMWRGGAGRVGGRREGEGQRKKIKKQARPPSDVSRYEEGCEGEVSRYSMDEFREPKQAGAQKVWSDRGWRGGCGGWGRG